MASHLEKENFGSLMSLLLEKILLDVLFIAFTHPGISKWVSETECQNNLFLEVF